MAGDTPTMTEQTEHAKALHAHITKMANTASDDASDKATHTIMLYAGMLAETLFEYEEPDVVMEQTFYRIAELMDTEPEDVDMEVLDKIMPDMAMIDRYTEKGRYLSLQAAEQLENDLEDVHEIVIGLIISDFPAFGEDENIDITSARCMRILMEMVIICAIFEMSAQEFCDTLVEDFIGEGWAVDLSLASLSGLAMTYGLEALEERKVFSKGDIKIMQDSLLDVVREEANRHSDDNSSEWSSMIPVNDEQDNRPYKEMIEELRMPIEEFFNTVGFDNKKGRAVAVARAVGRMVAVSTSEDAGYMPEPVAQMLVWRGMRAVLSDA